MKEHLYPEDLKGLSESQKETLRYLWLPEVNDLVMASICVNVETDEYQDIVFVVGEVILGDNKHNPSVTLRRYRLLDDNFFEENQHLFENEGSFELEYSEPEQFFNKEDCLPLLSVGQLIKFLRNKKYGQNGYRITIPPLGNKLFTELNYMIEDNYGEANKGEELCDVLWESLKEVLS